MNGRSSESLSRATGSESRAAMRRKGATSSCGIRRIGGWQTCSAARELANEIASRRNVTECGITSRSEL